MVKRCAGQELRFRNFDARNEKWVRSSGYESQGIRWHVLSRICDRDQSFPKFAVWLRGLMALKEEKEFGISGKQKVSVREETNAVSDTRVMIVQKRHQKPLHLLSFQWHEVEARREREASEAEGHTGRILRQPCRYYLKGTCTRSPGEYWHPSECQFYKSETGCKFGAECSFPHWKVQKTKKDGDQSAVAVVKRRTTVGLRISGHRAAGIESLSISWKSTKVFGPIRRVRFTKATQRHANIRGNKGPSLRKMQIKSSHQRSPYAVKFEDRSQEETERQERCVRGDAWKLAENIYKVKETEKATFYSPSDEWVLPAASLRKLWIRRQWRGLATQAPYFNNLRAAHGEDLLDRETKIWSQSDGSNERPRCEHSDMRYICACHSWSCSSSWERLHRKSAIDQESTLEILETVTSSDWEVDHGSDRNYWTDHDWLAAAYVERERRF